jgi:hypothetical protein
MSDEVQKLQQRQRRDLARMDAQYEAVRDLVVKKNAEELERLIRRETVA